VPSDLPAGQAQSFSLDTSKMNEALITRAAGAGSLTDRADGAAMALHRCHGAPDREVAPFYDSVKRLSQAMRWSMVRTRTPTPAATTSPVVRRTMSHRNLTMPGTNWIDVAGLK
jgi:hypothetical protein